ncbi:MAG: hypothetical protein EPO21_01740 [Chloroflexota bacterium]|nr:MAG: hypothetical protein EPO21_01740 [Chloroflexota bacterium]
MAEITTKATRPIYMAAILLVVTVLARLPFRSEMLYHWDSANFALALIRFDPTQHQPQPPGYLFYVAGAWLLQRVVGDANQALVLEGILFSGLAVAATYLVGRKLFDGTVGAIAALLLATSVTYWTYADIAFPYVALACFSATLGWAAWTGKRGFLATAVYAVAGGFRQDLLLFLAPLWLYSLRGLDRRRAALCILLAALGALNWAVPTLYLSGGARAYIVALTAQSGAVAGQFSVASHGLSALANNVGDLARYVWYALYAQAALLIPALIWLAIERRLRLGQPENRHRLLLLGLWVAPVLLFYAFIHIGDAGYVFTFLPAVELVLAAALVWPLRAAPRAASLVLAAVVILVMGLNTGIFLFHDRQLTALGIREQDTRLRETISFVQENYPAGSVLLLASSSYRHMAYYLPEYSAYWINRDSTQSFGIQLPASATAVVLVDDDLSSLMAGQTQEISLPSGNTLQILQGRPGSWLTFGGQRISLEQ